MAERETFTGEGSAADYLEDLPLLIWRICSPLSVSNGNKVWAELRNKQKIFNSILPGHFFRKLLGGILIHQKSLLDCLDVATPNFYKFYSSYHNYAKSSN